VSDPVRLRYVALPNRSLLLAYQRGLFWFAITALIVPALWILAGVMTGAPDVGRRVTASSVWFGFGSMLAWAAWHTAYEVIVEGDEVRWRGFAGRGRARLSRLRRIRESPIGRKHVEFDFGRFRHFTIPPAEGLAELVERLQATSPYLQVQLPPSVWRAGRRRHRGLFEETLWESPGSAGAEPGDPETTI
jgi:hypothetical protein